MHLSEDAESDEALGLEVDLVEVLREREEDVREAQAGQVGLQDVVLQRQGHHAQQRAQLHHRVLTEAPHRAHYCLQAPRPRHAPLVALRPWTTALLSTVL